MSKCADSYTPLINLCWLKFVTFRRSICHRGQWCSLKFRWKATRHKSTKMSPRKNILKHKIEADWGGGAGMARLRQWQWWNECKTSIWFLCASSHHRNPVTSFIKYLWNITSLWQDAVKLNYMYISIWGSWEWFHWPSTCTKLVTTTINAFTGDIFMTMIQINWIFVRMNKTYVSDYNSTVMWKVFYLETLSETLTYHTYQSCK